MTIEYNETIEKGILDWLDGWILINPKTETDDDSDEIQNMLDETEYDELLVNKKITSSQLQSFWKKADKIVNRFIGPIPESTYLDSMEIEEGIILWCAGLIWNKHNLKVYNQEDETSSTGYGDKLINDARKDLEPYRYVKLVAW